MIDITIIIIIFVSLILYRMFRIPIEIEMIVDGLLITTLCSYIAYNTTNVSISQTFLILSIVAILITLVLIILKYISKIRIWR